MAGSMTSIDQWSSRLACQIVKTQFGDLCEGVLSALIRKGRQTLPELLRSSQLAPALLKQVLLVLLQQNCVHAYLQPEEELVSGHKPSYYLYEAQLGWILQSIRMPKFLVHISEQWGEEEGPVAECLVEVLLEHGRLRLDQVVSAVQARLTTQQEAADAAAQQRQQAVAAATAAAAAGKDGQQQEVQEDPDAAMAGPSSSSAAVPDEETIRRIFFTLVVRRYVERCPPCGLPPSMPSAHPLSAKGRKSAKPGSAGVAESQAEALRTLAKKRYLDERFTIPADLALADGSGAAPTAANDDEDAAADGDVDNVEQMLEHMEVDADGVGGAGGRASSSRAGGAGASKGSKRVRASGALGGAGLYAGRAAKRTRRDDALAVAATAAAAQGSEEEEEAGLVVKRRSKKGAKGPLEDEDEDGMEEDEPAGAEAAAAAAKSGRGAAAGAKGAARRKEKGGGAEGSGGSGATVLWRANFEEFNRVFRHTECVKVVAEKNGADAGTVLAAMLLHGARFETTLQEGRSVPMSVMDVVKAMETLQAQGRVEPGWTMSEVEHQLQQLAQDAMGIVSDFEGGPSGCSYCVNMLPILETARHQQLQAVVRDRFGPPGLRIFNMLIQKGQLEQKQIADFGMLPAKETRELLYKMLKAGYLALQDIPKSSERLPVRTIFTWRVSLKDAYARLADELYRAAGNVQARYAHEVAQHKELLVMVEEAREAGTLHFNWTHSQRKALTQLQKVTQMLDTALLRLDDQIALFNEY